MKLKKIATLLTAAALSGSLLAACSSSPASSPASSGSSDQAAASSAAPAAESSAAESEAPAPKDILNMTCFIAMPGSEINDDNEIQQIIAEKTGVKVKETWLTGQTDDEAIGTIIAGGDYPDFINGGEAMAALYDAGALVAWDDYLASGKYPNLAAYYSDKDWDKFRQDDGKIYWANVFQRIHGEDRTTTHNDEAFWIQAKVLAWDNYPKIETMDEYFDLLERYAAANPTMADGTEVIPYTILCEDWRYFCLENAPQFLDGYPNDGCAIVDMDTHKVVDYNTTETAQRYFQKLNEEYLKGQIDPEFATQNYDQYIAKLSTGRVLGMIDQWWDFFANVNDSFKQQGLDLEGCNYVPLGLTIDPGMTNQWRTEGGTLNNSSGIAITVDCQDIDAAFGFLEACLDQDIHNLRFWGEEGVDYQVDENGLFYRTEDQRMEASDTAYKASHLCAYSYFPQWGGTSTDGINAMSPTEQTSEFQSSLAQPLIDCFNAYGVDNYVQLLGSVKNVGPWFPLYSFSNALTTETPGGVAWTKMAEVKHMYLPQVVMAEDFSSTWDEYMEAYAAVKPEDFIAEAQAEVDKRIAADAE